MKRNYCFIILALSFGLFIYLFYRTGKTVINEIFISLISFDRFVELRKNITGAFPLNKHIIYSLPEGLWVFCITLTSKYFFLKIGRLEFNLIFLPLIFSIGLELFQLLHLTNGQFDFWDIGVSVLFWAIANYFIKSQGIERNVLKPFTINSFICFLSYMIVYFAHVWR